MYTARFLFSLISLLAALLVAAGAAVFHWATFGRPDALETPGITLGLLLILLGGAAIVGAGQRLEGAARRVDGVAIVLIGLLLAGIGRIAAGGVTSTSGTLVGGLLLTIGAYLIALSVKHFWPVLVVGLITVPILRFGEYAALAGMPMAGWLTGASVGLLAPDMRRVPLARVGLLMSGVAAALLIALPAASAQSIFASQWMGLFASLLWLAGWTFVGFATIERWPAIPLMVSTSILALGAAIEGPIPIQQGWAAFALGVFVVGVLVPALSGASYLIGAFFGGRVALPNEPRSTTPAPGLQP